MSCMTFWLTLARSECNCWVRHLLQKPLTEEEKKAKADFDALKVNFSTSFTFYFIFCEDLVAASSPSSIFFCL